MEKEKKKLSLHAANIAERFKRRYDPREMLPMEYAAQVYSDEVLTDLNKSRKMHVVWLLAPVLLGIGLSFLGAKIGNFYLMIVGLGGGFIASSILPKTMGSMWDGYLKAYRKSAEHVDEWEKSVGIYFEPDDEAEDDGTTKVEEVERDVVEEHE